MESRKANCSCYLLCALSVVLLMQPYNIEANAATNSTQALYHRAQYYAENGQIERMTNVYANLLQRNAEDSRARTGYAQGLSWQGKHAQAQQQFRQVLAEHPDNLQAVVGLAYDLAWDKRYAEARQFFNKAITLAPDNHDARKGLAYTYLWASDFDKAKQLFSKLNKKVPNDAEVQKALVQIEQASKQQFTLNDVSQGVDYNSFPTTNINNTLSVPEQPLSISLWAGNTSNGGGSGLRELLLGYDFKSDLRLWGKFDNSLAMDNPVLSRTNQSTDTFSVGLLSPVGGNVSLVAEIGNRQLPAGDDQMIYKLEAFTHQSGNLYKSGFQLSPHSDGYTDVLLYASTGWRHTSGWRLEPTLYLSQSGALDDREWRTVLFAEKSMARAKLGLSAGLGGISSSIPSADGGVITTSVQWMMMLNRRFELGLSLRYENAPQNDFFTTLIGLSTRI